METPDGDSTWALSLSLTCGQPAPDGQYGSVIHRRQCGLFRSAPRWKCSGYSASIPTLSALIRTKTLTLPTMPH